MRLHHSEVLASNRTLETGVTLLEDIPDIGENDDLDLESTAEKVLGRPRQKASLGRLSDFPTVLQESMSHYDLAIEKLKLLEEVKAFRFRTKSYNRYVFVHSKHLLTVPYVPYVYTYAECRCKLCSARDTYSIYDLDALLRALSAPVKRWPHQEALDSSEPLLGCGFPVCTIVDMRPKRFLSLCNLTAWMKEQGLERRVLEVQKGACEDASKLRASCH